MARLQGWSLTLEPHNLAGFACAGRLVRPLLEGHRPAEGEVESFSVSKAARHCSCMPLPWWCVSRLEARVDCGPPWEVLYVSVMPA